jgi:hypothetical protein
MRSALGAGFFWAFLGDRDSSTPDDPAAIHERGGASE